jgi:hypothetical protein
MSRLLLESRRHDELTVQVPTTSPPQAETLVQDPELPPVLEFPPDPVDPPLLEFPPEPFDPPLLEPPEPDWPPDWAHPTEMIPRASANARAGDWAFIEVSLEPASGRLVRGIASNGAGLSEKVRSYLP